MSVAERSLPLPSSTPQYLLQLSPVQPLGNDKDGYLKFGFEHVSYAEYSRSEYFEGIPLSYADRVIEPVILHAGRRLISPMADFFTVADEHFISDRFKTLLEQFTPPEVEFYKCFIKTPDGDLEAEPYWWLNVTRQFDIIDWGQAEGDVKTLVSGVPRMHTFRKMVLTVPKVDADLFHIRGMGPQKLFISPGFAAAIEATQLNKVRVARFYLDHTVDPGVQFHHGRYFGT